MDNPSGEPGSELRLCLQIPFPVTFDLYAHKEGQTTGIFFCHLRQLGWTKARVMLFVVWTMLGKGQAKVDLPHDFGLVLKDG